MPCVCGIDKERVLPYETKKDDDEQPPRHLTRPYLRHCQHRARGHGTAAATGTTGTKAQGPGDSAASSRLA
jgi:hypothetical protein